jgi:Ca2+-binding RTX toxin-like protein
MKITAEATFDMANVAEDKKDEIKEPIPKYQVLEADMAYGINVREINPNTPAQSAFTSFTTDDGTLYENGFVLATNLNDNIIKTGDLDTTVNGSTQKDTITAQSGNDILKGGRSEDTITGGFGNDVIVGDGDVEVTYNADGTIATVTHTNDSNNINYEDTVDFSTLTSREDATDKSGVEVNISNFDDMGIVAGTSTGEGEDRLYSIEHITGSALKDTLIGSDEKNTIKGENEKDIIKGKAGNDYLDGGAKDDTIFGGEGNDTILGGAGNDTVNFSEVQRDNATDAGVNVKLYDTQTDDGVGSATGEADTQDLLYSIENIVGSDYQDTFVGDSNNNTIDGGAGIDTVDFRVTQSNSSVDVFLNKGIDAEGNKYGDSKGDGSDILYNIENVIGSQSNDTIRGDELANKLEGFDGKDTLYGNQGDDTLLGQIGDDTLEGGEGDDTLKGGYGDDLILTGLGDDTIDGDGDPSQSEDGEDTLSYYNLDLSTDEGVVVKLHQESAQDTRVAGIDTITNIENLIGTTKDDTLAGESGSNTIDGSGGIDTVDYSYIDSGLGIKVNLSSSLQMGDVEASTVKESDGVIDTLRNIENVMGSKVVDSIIGSQAANVIDALDGDDYVDGGDGEDTIDGGKGDDELLGNDGDDSIYGSSGDDTIKGGAGDDFIDGGYSYISYMTLGALDSNHTFKIHNTDDSVNATISYDNTSAGKSLEEVLDALVTAFNNSADALLLGSASHDGFQLIINTNESISDASGTIEKNITEYQDTVDYSEAESGVSVELAESTFSNDDSVGTATATIGLEEDTLKNIENIIGSTSKDVLAGNSENNTLLGNRGNDTLDGGAGDDRLFGGLNSLNDTLTGDDVFIASSGDDYINGGDGDNNSNIADSDTVDYSSWTAGALDITLNGSDVADFLDIDNSDGNTIKDDAGNTSSKYDSLYNIENITGTNLDDTIVGDSEDNTFLGMDGNDFLDGGLGDDSLDGGLGNDIIRGGQGTNVIEGGNAVFTVDISTIVQSTADTTSTYGFKVGNAEIYFDLLNGTTYSAEDIYDELKSIFDTKKDDGDLDLQNSTLVDNGTSLTLNTEKNVNLNRVEMNISGGDTLDYSYITSQNINQNVTIDLTSNSYQTTYQDTSELVYGIENIIGGRKVDITLNDGKVVYEDTLIGNSGDNTIQGLEGDDSLDGGAGNDKLEGGAGNDKLKGGAGDDQLIGGDGDDTADYSDATENIYVNLATMTQGSSIQISENLGSDTFGSIEGIEAGSGDDTLIGDSGSNTLIGGAGNDTISGGGAGSGTDVIDGGLDEDFVSYADQIDTTASGDKSVNIDMSITDTQKINNTLGNLNISNIENLEGTRDFDNGDILGGTDEDNIISGREGDDTLRGRGGSDTIIGGQGQDTLDFTSHQVNNTQDGIETATYSKVVGDPGASTDVDVNSNITRGIEVDLTKDSGQVINDGSNKADTVYDIENIVGSGFSDIITGADYLLIMVQK